MAEKQPPLRGADLAELREHARSLAADLAGTLRRVCVTSGDAAIEIEWQAAPPAAAPVAPLAPLAPVAPSADAGEHAGPALLVTSPMVGTFHRSPEPGASPFVNVGDTVLPGQTVAIVEAMKLFNPITADHGGVVAAVLAENGQPVEFGQPLLRLLPVSLNGTRPE